MVHNTLQSHTLHAHSQIPSHCANSGFRWLQAEDWAAPESHHACCLSHRGTGSKLAAHLSMRTLIGQPTWARNGEFSLNCSLAPAALSCSTSISSSDLVEAVACFPSTHPVLTVGCMRPRHPAFFAWLHRGLTGCENAVNHISRMKKRQVYRWTICTVLCVLVCTISAETVMLFTDHFDDAEAWNDPQTGNTKWELSNIRPQMKVDTSYWYVILCFACVPSVSSHTSFKLSRQWLIRMSVSLVHV